MSRRTLLLAIVLAGASGAACATGSGSAGAPTSLDAALGEAARAWAESFESKDAARITSYFADDAVAWFPRGARPTIGSAAIEAAWVSYFRANPAHPVRIDSLVVPASGELGLVYGRYLYRDAADPAAEGGRFIAIWRPVEGRWRLALLSAHKHDDISAAAYRIP
jgi:ketosteroid isomerase-like protein